MYRLSQKDKFCRVISSGYPPPRKQHFPVLCLVKLADVETAASHARTVDSPLLLIVSYMVTRAMKFIIYRDTLPPPPLHTDAYFYGLMEEVDCIFSSASSGDINLDNFLQSILVETSHNSHNNTEHLPLEFVFDAYHEVLLGDVDSLFEIVEQH